MEENPGTGSWETEVHFAYLGSLPISGIMLSFPEREPSLAEGLPSADL